MLVPLLLILAQGAPEKPSSDLLETMGLTVDDLRELQEIYRPPEQQLERFQLFNRCRPMQVLIGFQGRDRTALGLNETRLSAAVESRLRSARLFTKDRSASNGSILYAHIHIVGAAFSISLVYEKSLRDPVTTTELTATTWRSSFLGTHANDGNSLVQTLSEMTDRFLVEYFRVNEEECGSASTDKVLTPEEAQKLVDEIGIKE